MWCGLKRLVIISTLFRYAGILRFIHIHNAFIANSPIKTIKHPKSTMTTTVSITIPRSSLQFHPIPKTSKSE